MVITDTLLAAGGPPECRQQGGGARDAFVLDADLVEVKPARPANGDRPPFAAYVITTEDACDAIVEWVEANPGPRTDRVIDSVLRIVQFKS